jgi:hypothetical protein
LARRNKSVYGHHGTTKEHAETIIRTGFQPSEKESDWLGFGIYFWEDSPGRARLWCQEKFPDQPACVLDAEISLTNCLNLANPEDVAILKPNYWLYIKAVGMRIAASLKSTRRGNRQLDCRVINLACERWHENGVTIEVVRGPFQEGKPIFPGWSERRSWRRFWRRGPSVAASQIYDLSHVQLAVRESCAILDLRMDDEEV